MDKLTFGDDGTYMTLDTFGTYQKFFDESTDAYGVWIFIVPQRIKCTRFRNYEMRHWFIDGLTSRLSAEGCLREMNRVLSKYK